MTSRREILLASLDRWFTDGLIDEETHVRLAERVMTDTANELAVTSYAEPPRSHAGEATQFVGGLLLGAALVALGFFMGLENEGARWFFLIAGAVAAASGLALHFTAGPARASLSDAAIASGLVPLGMAAVTGFDSGNALIGIIVAAIAVGIHVAKQGHGPVILLCVAVVSLASFSATADLFSGTDATRAGSWLFVLLGYLGLTLVWREGAWSSAAAGALVIPISIASIMLLSEMVPRLESQGYELVMATLLGALFALGLWLDVRGLVASAAAGLTIDAVIFAADLGGAGTAVVVLLALGGLLIWQGQGIRTYFRRAPKREGL